MTQVMTTIAVEMIRQFTTLLFEERSGQRHVRKIAPWIGLVGLGIAKVGHDLQPMYRNRVSFTKDGQSYRMGFKHSKVNRGFLEIYEMQGRSRGDTVVTISDVLEARDFYEDPESHF